MKRVRLNIACTEGVTQILCRRVVVGGIHAMTHRTMGIWNAPVTISDYSTGMHIAFANSHELAVAEFRRLLKTKGLKEYQKKLKQGKLTLKRYGIKFPVNE